MTRYTAGDEPVPGAGYRLVEFLGRGGFGEVWKATAPGGAEVAVKILSLDGVQGRKEFRALQLVKRIRHPNLTPLVAFWLKAEDGTVLAAPPDETVVAPGEPPAGEVRATLAPPAPSDAGRPAELVLVMGLGDKTLFDRLQERRQEGAEGIPPGELLAYMEDAARAIDYLNRPIHAVEGGGQAAVQHCDIKPHNIMIVGGATQVCDFGLAKTLGAERTTSTAATLAYAAPEFLRDGRPSPTTDQYSLAITYYELRTGQLPYVQETAVAVMNAKLEGKLDFSGVTAEETAVLRRATDPDPAARYETAGAMVQALRRALEPGGSAAPPSARARRRVRAAGVLIVAVLGTAAAWAAWRFWPGPRTPPPLRGGDEAGGQRPAPAPEEDQPPLHPSAVSKQPEGQPPQDSVDKLLGPADQALAEGRYVEALELYQRAAEASPGEGAAYWGRGRCQLALNDFDAALASFQRAAELDAPAFADRPEWADAYLGRGTGRLSAGQLNEAIADLTEAARRRPDDGRIFSRLGAAHFLQGEWLEAVQQLTAAIQLDRDPGDLVRRGRALRNLDRLDEAVADFRQAIALDPQRAAARFYLADCLLDRNSPAEAEQLLSEAIRLSEDRPPEEFSLGDAYATRGLCRMMAQKFEEAVADLTAALQRQEADPKPLHQSRAACLEELGRTTAARYDREILRCLGEIAQHPGDHLAFNEIAYYLATCPEEEIRDGQRAVRLATRACELTDWKEPEYLDTLAAAYAEAGDFANAVRWERKALELAPDEEARARFAETLKLFQAGRPKRDAVYGSEGGE